MSMFKRHLNAKYLSASFCIGAGVLFCAVGARANPNGGTVTGGNASIAGQGSAQVTVTQTTD